MGSLPVLLLLLQAKHCTGQGAGGKNSLLRNEQVLKVVLHRGVGTTGAPGAGAPLRF